MKGKIALLSVLALCISGFYVAHAETPAVEKDPSMAESVGSTVLEPTDGMQTVCVSDSYELRVNAENGTFALAGTLDQISPVRRSANAKVPFSAFTRSS